MPKRFGRALRALSALPIVAGCATSPAPPVRPALPDLPGALRRDLTALTPAIGEDARLFAARQTARARAADRARRDLVVFYDAIRREFGAAP
jgi:hypothetical protein